MSTFYKPTSELYHHGILGMKWGVRRYVNKDGSLTDEGLRRLKHRLKSTNDKQEERTRKELSDKGVVEGLDYDIIKKGSTLNRFTGAENETYDNYRKYASVTENDRWAYDEFAFQKVLDNTGAVYLDEMVAQKDLKVAKGRDVLRDVVDEYGDKPVKDAFKVLEITEGRDLFYTKRDILKGPRKDRWMVSAINANQKKIAKWSYNLTHQPDPPTKEIFDKYAKKGYDAVVDFEDWSNGMDYPVVILKPGDTVKRKKSKKVMAFDDDDHSDL